MVRILLVSIVNRNLGDTVIADTAEYYLKRALPRWKRENYQIYRYNIYREDDEFIRLADLIIFAGGGIIKFRKENFYEYAARVLEVAEEEGIPVFFNCVGVEGFDGQDERCLMLKRALNLSCVKGISVRDDMETLRQHYIENGGVRLIEAIDPAVACRFVYQTQRKKDSRLIGLGIIRDAIFEDYGIEGVDKEFQLQLWVSLIRKIEEKGYEWQLFSNGLKSDQEFALEVLEHYGIAGEAGRYLAKRPVTAGELVDLIAGYQAVVAGRMHSNIIAYALGIPSIALVWNEKLNFWGQRIGYPERFVTAEQLTAETLSDALFESMGQGVLRSRKAKSYERNLRRELAHFVREYDTDAEYSFWAHKIRPRLQSIFGKPPARKKYFPWHKYLVATALGGEELQYGGMNHLGTMRRKFDEGFRRFEADVRLTDDGVPVCVNGWSEKTYRMLELAPEDYRERPPSYDVFSKCRSYGKYGTTRLEPVLEMFHGFSGKSLILDIGRPNEETLQRMLAGFERIFTEHPEWMAGVKFRLQTPEVCDAFLDSPIKYSIVYYIPSQKVRKKQRLSLRDIAMYCKSRQIRMVTVGGESLTEDVVQTMHKHRIQVCVFSYNTYTEIKQALEMGADFVGTHHIGVRMLKKMGAGAVLP